MSAETRANAIVLKFLGRLQPAGRESIPDGSVRWLRDAICEAIVAAAEREREACARIADAIRERGKRIPPAGQLPAEDRPKQRDGLSLQGLDE